MAEIRKTEESADEVGGGNEEREDAGDDVPRAEDGAEENRRPEHEEHPEGEDGENTPLALEEEIEEAEKAGTKEGTGHVQGNPAAGALSGSVPCREEGPEGISGGDVDVAQFSAGELILIEDTSAEFGDGSAAFRSAGVEFGEEVGRP